MFQKGIPSQLHLSSRLDWINFAGGGFGGWGQQHNDRRKEGRKKERNVTTDKQTRGLIEGERGRGSEKVLELPRNCLTPRTQKKSIL